MKIWKKNENLKKKNENFKLIKKWKFGKKEFSIEFDEKKFL